jgi:hypothetical protein
MWRQFSLRSCICYASIYRLIENAFFLKLSTQKHFYRNLLSSDVDEKINKTQQNRKRACFFQTRNNFSLFSLCVLALNPKKLLVCKVEAKNS